MKSNQARSRTEPPAAGLYRWEDWWGTGSASSRRVRSRTEPPAVGAARVLRWVHDTYRAERAKAKQMTTALLEVEDRRYRQCGWLSRHDRARLRALREELRDRGVVLPPVVLASPRRGPRGMRRVVR